MRIYLKDKQALAYFNKKATPDFWDAHWEIDELRSYILSFTTDGEFIPLIKKYLPEGSTVLEGGCGRGQIVHALRCQDYKSIGIDFAQKTVRKINEAVPELDVRIGDVRDLPIKDNTLDGYISNGVIEHFWCGYHSILSEMKRTLKTGGFLFISFPYMSPIRRLKVRMGNYLVGTMQQFEDQQDTFYQFALNWKQVTRDIQKFGFTLLETKPYSGIKGFKDELTWFKPWLQPYMEGKPQRRIVRFLDKFFTPFASHCIILVMKLTTK